MIAALVFVQPADAVQYTFTTFDVPGGTQTEIIGLNNVGQFVGSYGPQLPNQPSGFLYSSGVITSIAYPGAAETNPYGINDAGDIVGEYVSNGVFHGFLLQQGVYTTIDGPDVGYNSARGINNAGQIVGLTGSGGFLWSNGNFSLLNELAGVHPYDINDLGVIVGTRSFRFSGGVLEDLTALGYVFNTNTAGDLVGATGGGSGSFISSGGIFTGLSFGDLGGSPDAAHAINDLGQIAGYYTDSAGIRHGYIASPVPEPGVVFLLSIGLAGVASSAWRARRRRG